MNIPVSEWSGSGATERLRESMEAMGAKTDRLTRWLVALTVALVVMTAVLVWLTLVLVLREKPAGTPAAAAAISRST